MARAGCGQRRRQPFPSVWPVRTLRSDVEPANFIARLGLYSMDNGSPIAAGTWVAAKAGADAAATAARLLSSGVRAVFCATRPPGHHAGADFMGGYCFLNNAAVAAQSLRERGCARVAVLDVDYHHGNGTQSIFYERADVLVVSLHGDPRTEYPFYFGHADETGAGSGQGFNLNLPLAAGSSAATWFDALDAACARVMRYRPDALVVSLGLDTFAGDPISSFALQADDFPAWVRGSSGWACRRCSCWRAVTPPANSAATRPTWRTASSSGRDGRWPVSRRHRRADLLVHRRLEAQQRAG